MNKKPIEKLSAETKVDSSTTDYGLQSVRRHNTNTNVGRGAVYVLATNWGQFLESVSQSAGTLIFNYTNRIFDGYVMNKKEADYFCSIKPFFKPMKIAQ